jgi:hypothetical protein
MPVDDETDVDCCQSQQIGNGRRLEAGPYALDKAVVAHHLIDKPLLGFEY